MSDRVATTVWWVSPEVVRALDDRLGPPVDSYLNGSQTWLTVDGPGGATLEWRLHPVSAFVLPRGMSHYDLWERVNSQLSGAADPDALALGDQLRALSSLWEGLECYPAYGDDIEPANLARAAGESLGIPPDLHGLVDHGPIADAWEQSHGEVSIVARLAEQLRS